MNKLKQQIRDLLATQVASVLKRFAFDPRYFDLWQSYGFHVKPVNFYSPIPNTQELPDELWSKKVDCSAINWNESGQLQLLEQFSHLYRQEYEDFPQTKPAGKPPYS